MPKNVGYQNNEQSFVSIDHIFSNLGISDDKKSIIYRFLAAILHLGNIEFGSHDSADFGGGAQIIESTARHVEFAARLLNVSPDKFKWHLLHSSVNFSNTTML